MNVVLIGMKGSGKSTLGAALAKRWGCDFYDVDPMMEQWHACETGQKLTVREIYSKFGEEYFHKIEGNVVCELCLKLNNPDKPHVVALGGRTVINERVRELLGAIGTIVYIQVSPDRLYERVEKLGMPPFINSATPKEDFLALCLRREPEYEHLAHLTANVDGMDVEQAVDEIIRRLNRGVK